MSFKNILLTTIFTVLISSLVFVVGYAKEVSTEPREVYQVYLDGKKIGIIDDKESLLNLIDNEGKAIKEKYNVDKVYPPNGLEIRKYITFEEKTTSIQEIYNYIKEKRPFTISAYIVKIKPDEGEEKLVYVLSKEIFDESLKDYINVFIPKEEYDAYLNNNQATISDVGEIIETIYFDETITIKNTYINAENEIFSDSDKLTQYLLFGTNEKQKTYVVKLGEDIEKISYNHQLNSSEFLIANPNLVSANQLLSPGQIVNIGLINPLLTLSYELHVIDDEESIYDTEVEYDTTLTTGTKYVKQEGENGINRITKKVLMKNGDVDTTILVSSTEIKPSVSKVVVKGNKSTGYYDADIIWRWPTEKPYSISSPFGYRGGDLHAAVDITGKHGSPIAAAAGGTVYYAQWQAMGGNVVQIDHHNGYYTEYAHLSKMYVSVGQEVFMGTTIGAMGKTGYAATGTHLHFGIWFGKPHWDSSRAINPLSVF